MVRKARTSEVRTVQGILNSFASDGKLLPRSLNDLYTHFRDIFVYVDEASGEVIGCCCLNISWEDLAEIRSLAVAQKHQGRGVGKALVRACIEEARELEIGRVFALTYVVEFFERLGFRVVDKGVFPQKIWADCVNCLKFPECDETAMALDLGKVVR